jgi:branched-chain amino acid transport system permease protein
VVRTRGIYFIMVTMAFAQMLFFLFFDNKALGGSDGLYINFKPDAGCSTWRTSASSTTSRWPAWCWRLRVLRRLLWSPFGRALAGIRVNEHRMRAMGFGTFGYKLTAFTLAGALAGLAGYLWGAQTGFVNPELMGFHMSAHAIMMVILGGMGNFAGRHRRRLCVRIHAGRCSRTCPPSAPSTPASTGSCGWACSSWP